MTGDNEMDALDACVFSTEIKCKENKDCKLLFRCEVCFCTDCLLAACIGQKHREERKMSGDDEMNALDACVFSGDILYVNLASFKEYLARWNRAIESHEKSEKEEE